MIGSNPTPACNQPLFNVRPNLSTEDALVHLASYLRAGEAAAYELTDSPGHNAGGLALSVVHSIESAQVIVEMLLTARIQREH